VKDEIKNRPLKILNPFIIMGIFSFLINTGRIYFYFRPQDREKIEKWVAEGKTEVEALHEWFVEICDEYYTQGPSVIDTDDFFKHHPEREP